MSNVQFERECPDLGNIIKYQIPTPLPVIVGPSAQLTIPRSEERLQIFRNIEQVSKEMDSRYEQLRSLFEEITCRANGFPSYHSPAQTKRITARAELAVLPISVLQTWVGKQVEVIVHEMMHGIVKACSDSVVWQRMGLARWLSEDVCRYFYFQQNTKQEQSRHDVGNAVRTDHQEVTTHGLYIHDVIEAKKTPAKKFDGTIPNRIKKVIEKIPSWLEPQIDIISGHQISQTTVEREVGRKVWSELTPKPQPLVRFDPCLSFGPFVLCGWEEGER